MTYNTVVLQSKINDAAPATSADPAIAFCVNSCFPSAYNAVDCNIGWIFAFDQSTTYR